VTFTINVSEIFRFLFIGIWLVAAGAIGVAMLLGADKDDKAAGCLLLPLLLGSAIILYLGGRP
jgi:hypothetical protein